MDNHLTMVRKPEPETGSLILSEDEIGVFQDSTVKPKGINGKADNPRRYIGRRGYVIITKNEELSSQTEKRNSVPHSSFHADSRG